MLTSMATKHLPKEHGKAANNRVVKDVVIQHYKESKDKRGRKQVSVTALKKCLYNPHGTSVPTRYRYALNGWKQMGRTPFLPVFLLH